MSYWEKRFLDLEAASNAYGVETFKQIEPAFDSAQRQIEREIERWYGRFAKNNQITMQEARKLLTSKELKELKWDVEEYIKYGRENAINQKWMKELENASARFHINRLEALKIRTQQAAEKAFGNELDAIDAMARKVFTEDYYHSIFEMQKGFGIGWDIGQIDERKLETLISKPWASDGKNFSSRIWDQKTALVNELHQQLTRTCILGKAPDDAIKAISRKFSTSKSNAGKLVMTEQAYFHSIAQKEAFKELDVEEFEFVATLDSRTSEVCREMDGKHLPMSEYNPGSTAPPLHPWCRSVTVPYFEDNFDGERAARGADGKTYYVPDKMKYNDWKECFVDKTKDPAEFLKPVDDVVDVIEEIIQAKTVEEAKKLLIDEIGFIMIEDSVKKIDDDLLIANTNQLIKLEKKFGAIHQSRSTICSVPSGDAMAYVSAITTHPTRQNLSLCPSYFSKKNVLLESERKYVGNGYSMPAKLVDEELSIYTVTHEYGHMIQNMLIENEMKLNGWDASKANAFVDMSKRTKKARYKWYNTIETKVVNDCMREIKEIAKENNESFNILDHISRYGKTNGCEFFAEVFANSQLSEPNELGVAMNIWLERKGLIK